MTDPLHHRPALPFRSFLALACVAACVLLLGACTAPMPTEPQAEAQAPPRSFEDYHSQTLARMRQARSFQHADTESELVWNGPREWRPARSGAGAKAEKGILLVHGLGDSPWSFHDLGAAMAAEGYLVRTVLLPGHGTRPADLLAVSAQQWRELVQEQARVLVDDVDGPVYLGGFSTGANLVLDYAYAHPSIAGLVLFSPGFKSMPFDWVAPVAARIRPWIVGPGDPVRDQTPVRYLNVPTNGFAQFYHTSTNARRLLSRTYDKPVFMAVAQHDSVLDTAYLLDVFQRRFTHPDSRLIWYGAAPRELADTRRVLVRGDSLPAYRISQFSHMGLLFSPSNALYGEGGRLRICQNGQAERVTRACLQGEAVWYSDWGYREPGKIHARLTFNPYFDWQTSVLLGTFGSSHSANIDVPSVNSGRRE